MRDFTCCPMAKTPSSPCRGPRLNPRLGTRSHMPQLKILHATKKIPCVQFRPRAAKEKKKRMWLPPNFIYRQ